MRRLIVAGLVLGIMLVPGIASAGNGPPHIGFYVNGVQYRTVGTPTDLSDTGAPAGSFDTLYDFGGAQLNVATAAPGDAGYSGGRWQVHSLSFNSSYMATLAAHDLNGDGVIDTNAELSSALADASASGATDVGVVQSFECPVIPVAA